MSPPSRRWLLSVALVLLVVLAGCSGGADSASTMSADGGAQTEVSKADAASSSGGANAVTFQGQQRQIIRTGSVSLRVEDFDASRRNLTRAVESRGGYVSDSSERVRGDENRTWTTGQLVLRVPKSNFSRTFERVKTEGQVRESNTKSKDVTEKLVDVEARLENLRTQREKLRGLYEEANDTENVLAVQERLSEVQSEIERLEAQQKSLRQQVAYATITVEMRESPPERQTPESQSWYETGLLSAFSESVGGVWTVFRGLAVGTAYAAPYALAFGLPLGGVFAFWRFRS